MLCEIEGFTNGQQVKKLLDRTYEPLMKKYCLKKIELEVLFFLSSYQTFDTAKDIVNFKCLSKAHVSKAIENLTKRNYITSSSHKQDRRCIHLSLTDEAIPVIRELEKIWQELEIIIYKDISEQERNFFGDILHKISYNINCILDSD